MKRRQSTISEEDKALFRKSVGEITPLTSKPKVSMPKKSLPAEPEAPSSNSSRSHKLSQSLDIELTIAAEEHLSYAQNGIASRLVKKLRRGQFKIVATIDLHGCTMQQAEVQIGYFLHHSHHHQGECVKLIHGKGYHRDHHPKLKNLVNIMLRNHSRVLAFTSCQPRDGGAGAVYILLKA